MKRGQNFSAKEDDKRVELFYTNLVSSSFCPSLFEISLDRSCATPSVIQREDFSKSINVHPVNRKQDSLSTATQRTQP